MPSPSSGVAPWAAARSSQDVGRGAYTRSTATWPARSSSGCHGPRRRSWPPVMPSGVALTTRSARRHRAGHVPPDHRAGGTRQSGRLPRPGRCAVEHGDLGRPGVGQGEDDRPRRAAGADHQAAPGGRIEAHATGQRVHEPLAVGVGARERAVAVQDTVHRAQATGHLTRGVHESRHVRLVRHGDRQSAHVVSAHVLEGATGLARGYLESERPPPGQLQRREGCVVQQRREGMGDRAPDDTDHGGLGAAAGPSLPHGHGAAQGSPRDLASRSLAICSANVSEKAITPFFCTRTK